MNHHVVDLVVHARIGLASETSKAIHACVAIECNNVTLSQHWNLTMRPTY